VQFCWRRMERLWAESVQSTSIFVTSLFIREHEIADITKKARIYTILSEIFTLCLCLWKEYCFPVFSIICRVRIAMFNNKTGFFNDFDTISQFFLLCCQKFQKLYCRMFLNYFLLFLLFPNVKCNFF
jgi:hypothetical protein